ncbi:LOW QUALITY PROTEIN: sodium-coupled monocarboxylate transporter 1-like [Pristis pectinata]|uniref:LOW QUALITY PROTEIN: sodium-coupled monocarboxylate transporter 1-like n=1 Tax=Pristis pectinata TaxID=685728 RepID=UPI00223E8C59|nr:LOW QUALITY PROTEIN: sodium-coupled monocarboxylate transporter 1-like [Pristis pectinata]
MAESNIFQVWDYVVFAAMVLVSAAIGFFCAFKDSRSGQESTEEFLVGSRQISAYPIALSLASSFLSAITVIGNPTEVYSFGMMFLMFGFTWFITMTATSLIYIPLFYRLNIISTYEYLNRRFGKMVRYQVVCCFMIYMFFYLGIVTYAPSLALSQVTGINLWISIVTTAFVCTLYTALGGIKAVVWTDVFQLCIMVIGLLTVLIQGSIHIGGLKRFGTLAENGGRLNFLDFNPDPRRRHTFWTIIVGGTFGWTATYSCNQAQVQRYLACKSEKEAKSKAIFLNWIGMIIVLTTACLCGLVMYAVYETCDPIKANKISNTNQLMPLLVVEILNQTPGVAGLFVASAYSGTLSTISSGISAMAAIFVEDFIKPIWKPWEQFSNTKKTLVTKLLAMIFGLATIGLAGVASLLQGNIIQASLSIAGIIQGPILGVFTLAALFPKSNGKGAFVGLFVGLSLSLWVGIAAQIYPPADKFTGLLATSISGCLPSNFTTSTPMNVTPLLTTITSPNQERPSIVENFYSLSYLYYSPIACLSTVFVGLTISLVTGGSEKVDPSLISPVVHTIHKFIFRIKQALPKPKTNNKSRNPYPVFNENPASCEKTTQF